MFKIPVVFIVWLAAGSVLEVAGGSVLEVAGGSVLEVAGGSVLEVAGGSVLEGAGTGGHRSRPQRDISCREDQEYQHDNICCLSCPAGSYVQTPCTRAHERGRCELCDFDTFTEHQNGLAQCLKCTRCRPDQETVRRCESKQDTECQCRAGWFCDPDQACEVCQRCRTCKDDEEQVRNCSVTANAVCKSRPRPSSSGTTSAVAILIVLAAVTAVVSVMFWMKRRRQRGPEPHSDPSDMEKVVVSPSIEERQNTQNSQLRPLLQAQSVGHKASANKEKDNGLGDSLPSTTHSSLSSLTAPPSAPPPGPSPASQRQPREDDLLRRKLVPLNGDESLRECFQYFEELDVHFHTRFFRHIGLNENAIKSRSQNSLQPEDRVFELLTVWREKEGMRASINHLLSALLDLNQRLSAENIIAKAIESGHFEYEKD